MFWLYFGTETPGYAFGSVVLIVRIAVAMVTDEKRTSLFLSQQ